MGVRREPVLSTAFLGQGLWHIHRPKVTLTEMFDALKRLEFHVIQMP